MHDATCGVATPGYRVVQGVHREPGLHPVADRVAHDPAGEHVFDGAKIELALIGSMGQVGAAGDNAAMESFFALLQKNVLDRKRWRTREELRIAIITWIERTYHRRRRQARLGRLTPIEYETIMNPAVSLAA